MLATKTYSLLAGLVLLALGVLGFMQPAAFGLQFHPAHNIIHLGTGLLALRTWLRRGPEISKEPQISSLMIGVFYTLMAIAGFSGLQAPGALRTDLNWEFNLFYLVLGLSGMVVSVAGPMAIPATGIVAIVGYTLSPAPAALPSGIAPVPVPATGLMSKAFSGPQPAPAPPDRAVGLKTSAGAQRGQRVSRPAPPDRRAVGLTTVSGKILKRKTDCGGTDLERAFFSQFRGGKPARDRALYIREGATNSLSKPIVSVASLDADGKFQVWLPPGRYCIVGESKKDALKIPDLTEANKKLSESRIPSEPYRIVSEQCFRDWWRTCDKAIEVGNQNISGLEVKSQQSCLPACIQGGPAQ